MTKEVTKEEFLEGVGVLIEEIQAILLEEEELGRASEAVRPHDTCLADLLERSENLQREMSRYLSCRYGN